MIKNLNLSSELIKMRQKHEISVTKMAEIVGITNRKYLSYEIEGDKFDADELKSAIKKTKQYIHGLDNNKKCFHYISDIHIPHYKGWTYSREKIRELCFKAKVGLPLSNTIIIAGDLSESIVNTVEALTEFSKHYDNVLFTLGNHDLYLLESENMNGAYRSSDAKREAINNVIEEVSKELNKNIVLLDNKIVIIDGINIAGSTMWYKVSENEYPKYKLYSNDYTYIKGLSDFHDECIEFYNNLPKDIDIMVSHIPPVNPPESMFPYSTAYTTHVSELKPKHWVAGHQHFVTEFEVFKTKFYFNAHGYRNEYKNRVAYSQIPHIKSFMV